VTALLDVASALLLLVGTLFLLGGTVGLVRLPDLFARTHAATKCDTVGAGSILVAVGLQGGFGADGLKLAVLLLLILLSGPTTGHALARAAFRTGVTPWTRHRGDAP
jgi:multicomponent Na+:H+ antiporter subunit G